MLSKNEMGLLCNLFNRGGWVLDFSTNEFDTFTLGSVGIPLCEHYRLSKGKSLVAFINEASLADSQRLLFDLFEHYETRYQCEFESWDDYPHPQHADRNYGPRYRQCKKFVEREQSIASPYKQSADFIKKEFSSESMNEQIDLLMRMRTEHPTDAIGKSKEVLESCCKTILTNQGIDIPDDWDAPRLSKETAKLLKVSVGDVDTNGPEGRIVKQILGSLQGLATGVIEFRNAYGDGHGHAAQFQSLPVRHAKLAVGSCLTLVEYYWETYEWRKSRGLLK